MPNRRREVATKWTGARFAGPEPSHPSALTTLSPGLKIRGMAIHTIRKYPDPVLKTVAAAVSDISEEVCTLADDMLETMRAARGIGLAANQIGVPLRVITL